MKGHMSQTRKNKGKLRKKEPTPNLIGKEIEKEYFPEQSKTQTNLYYTKIIDTTGLTAMDLSGKPPITSSRGNKYIFL